MAEGMEMTKAQFLKLPRIERDACIYENISEIKKLVQGYRIYYKLTAIVGSVLTVGMGILFVMHFGG